MVAQSRCLIESMLSRYFDFIYSEISAVDRRYNQKYPFVVMFNLQIEFRSLGEQICSVAARDIWSSARLMSSTRPISQSRAALFRSLTDSLNACTNKAWSAIPLLRAEETTAVWTELNEKSSYTLSSELPVKNVACEDMDWAKPGNSGLYQCDSESVVQTARHGCRSVRIAIIREYRHKSKKIVGPVKKFFILV